MAGTDTRRTQSSIARMWNTISGMAILWVSRLVGCWWEAAYSSNSRRVRAFMVPNLRHPGQRRLTDRAKGMTSRATPRRLPRPPPVRPVEGGQLGEAQQVRHLRHPQRAVLQVL